MQASSVAFPACCSTKAAEKHTGKRDIGDASLISCPPVHLRSSPLATPTSKSADTRRSEVPEQGPGGPMQTQEKPQQGKQKMGGKMSCRVKDVLMVGRSSRTFIHSLSLPIKITAIINSKYWQHYYLKVEKGTWAEEKSTVMSSEKNNKAPTEAKVACCRHYRTINSSRQR